MAVNVLTETVIARPRDEVAAFAVDPDRIPLWYQHVKAIEWQTEPPLAVGSRVALVSRLLRQRLAYTYEVVEHTPGERFVMRSLEGSSPMETSYAWATMPDGRTRMTIHNHGAPTGILGWLGPIAGMAIRRANTKDLALLKAILERRAGRPSVA